MKIALTSDLHRGFTQKTHMIHNTFFKKLEEDKSWDVLLIAGDLATTKPEQVESLLKAIRNITSRDIAITLGNHDHWAESKDRKSVDLVIQLKTIQGYIEKYNCHYLSGNPYIKGDVAIIGWDGWYTHAPYVRGTRDHEMMPYFTEGIETERWLIKNAYKDECRVLEEITLHCDKKIVLVSHMPIISIPSIRHVGTDIPVLWDEVKNKIKAYCYGHVHRKNEEIRDGVRVYSADVDYDRPGAMFFEI